MRFSRKVWSPLRGEVGRNHVAQRGTVRGEVEILDGGFFLRASDSSAGVTRYEEKERWEAIVLCLNVGDRCCLGRAVARRIKKRAAILAGDSSL